MSISLVGVTTGDTSISPVPGRQAGDIELFWAYRDGSNTLPSEPLSRGWTTIVSNGAGTNSARLMYRLITEANKNELMGTSATVTALVSAVYRPAPGFELSIGAFDRRSGSTAVVQYPWITPQRVDPQDSIAVVFAGHRSVNTTIDVHPYDFSYSQRAVILNSVNEVALWDTIGSTALYIQTTKNVGGTTAGWQTMGVELLATPTGGGEPPVEDTVNFGYCRAI